jgi:hypothetical protein
MSDSSDNINEQICWIDTIDPSDALPELANMYQQVGAVHYKIHNLYRRFRCSRNR